MHESSCPVHTPGTISRNRRAESLPDTIQDVWVSRELFQGWIEGGLFRRAMPLIVFSVQEYVFHLSVASGWRRHRPIWIDALDAAEGIGHP